MKKVKKSSKSIKVTKRKINLKMAMLMASIILIVAVLIYGTLQKTFFAPKAAPASKINAKTAALLRLSCYNKFTKDYLKSKGFTKSVISNMVSDINTATFNQNSQSKQIKTYLAKPACDFNYTHIGDVGIASRYICCVTNSYINQLTMKKDNIVPVAANNNTSGKAAAPITEGTQVYDCGVNHTNCNSVYGTSISGNGAQYTVLCAKAADQGFKCAINMGSVTSCNNINSRVVNGSAANVLKANGRDVDFKVCWLN